MLQKTLTLLFLILALSLQAQKLKVEWVAGDVTIYKKGTTVTSKVKKNETIELGDRLYLGEKALLLVSDYSKKLFEVKKKGYITGKELSEGLLKTLDNEYQRYLAFILKELKNHESDMKSTEKGIPGAPSRGSDFLFIIPDTIMFFSNEQLPIRWVSSVNTEMVNVQLLTDKKNTLLDLDMNGDVFWFNNISTYFLINNTLHLYVYEDRTDGDKELKGHTVIKKSEKEEEKVKKELDEEFSELADLRLNMIAKATKWEINHYYLEALDIYKILLLDYPDDVMVKVCFSKFTERSGLQ